MGILAENKRGLFDAQTMETWDAGIVLSGAEVKSCRKKSVNFQGSYVSYGENERSLILKNFFIGAYQEKNQPGYNPKRPRQLLLHKKEVDEIRGKMAQKGLTVIPAKIYTHGGLIKVQLALVKPRKKYDKRERIKKRETKRQMERALKG